MKYYFHDWMGSFSQVLLGVHWSYDCGLSCDHTFQFVERINIFHSEFKERALLSLYHVYIYQSFEADIFLVKSSFALSITILVFVIF